MGLNWHLCDRLDDRDLQWEQLAERLSFPLPESWRDGALPADLTLEVLAELCGAIGVQPGELLTFTPETPGERASRELERNMMYQSFLAYKAQQDEEGNS